MDTQSIKQFEIAGSHFEVGLAIGEHFAEQIHQSLNSYEFFQQKLLPYHRTGVGQARTQDFIKLNRSRYPDYVAELEGMAQGADRPFEDMLLLNLRGEYRDYFYQFEPYGCADYAALTENTALIGHNEDGAPEFRKNMYLVRAGVTGKPAFTALSYPGFLCGNAFGFNDQGICFSVDNVRPIYRQAGLGRHFVARSLLEAESMADAIERVTVSGQASGFHYTIGSVTERRIVSVETSPIQHSVREIKGSYFHTNHYLELENVPQVVDPSSQARIERGRQILANNSSPNEKDVLITLCDQSHADYPIFGTEQRLNPLVTFFMAIFNLDAATLRIYAAPPGDDSQEFTEFSLV